MNIKKEREAFEKHASKFFITNEAFEDDGENYVYDEVKFMWDCWLAAKAQAVPEGFVLVPMVPSERMINAVRQCYEGEAYLPYSLYSEFVNQAIIERMEAQEPAND